jgi:hypothetical protein
LATYNAGASWVRLWSQPQNNVGLLADDTISMTLFADDQVLLSSATDAQ